MANGFLSRWIGLFKRGEILFPLFIFLSFLFLLRESSHYTSESGAFPKVIILSTILLTGGLLAKLIFIRLSRKTDVSPEPGDGTVLQKGWKTSGRFYRGWMSIAVSLLAAFLFGFLFLIPLSFISYTLLLGRKEMLPKILILAFATTVAIYLVFDKFLGVPMMHGVLWIK